MCLLPPEVVFSKYPQQPSPLAYACFSQDDVSVSIKGRRVERLNAQIYRVYEYGFRGFYFA